jgi:hypothetical protein
VHRELLAADRPVHEGVRFDAAPLLGRDADVRALRRSARARRRSRRPGPRGRSRRRPAARRSTSPGLRCARPSGSRGGRPAPGTRELLSWRRACARPVARRLHGGTAVVRGVKPAPAGVAGRLRTRARAASARSAARPVRRPPWTVPSG